MAAGQEHDITQLLIAWHEGDPNALDLLMPLIYQEIRYLAQCYLQKERPDHTLQATEIAHEAYMRIVDKTHPNWQGRKHFYAVTAQIMRRLLVDYARKHRATKRDRGQQTVDFTCNNTSNILDTKVDILDLDTALKQLESFDARKSRVIELRYFGGLTAKETADVLKVSEETIQLDSRLARSWLNNKLARQNQLSGAVTEND